MKQYEGLRHGTYDFPVGIHDTLCENGFSLYPHIHREFEFLIMREGEGVLYIEEEKLRLKKGEGVFINSEKLHIGIKTNSERAEFFAVVFSPEVFGNSFAKFALPVIEGEVEFEKVITEDMVQILFKIHENRENELLVKSYIFLLWNMCFENARVLRNVKERKGGEEIKRAMAYIREHLCEEITLDDMAECAQMSKSYFCRRFNSLVHMTPFKYLNEIRIEKSCEMLKNTNLPIGEIALKCGFNSFSYYSKLFCEKMGCTPREYKNK